MRSNRRRWRRVGGGEAALDLGDRRLGVARVVPPVRVVSEASSPSLLAGQAVRHDRAEVDDLGVAAAVGDDLVDPGVEAVAVGEDQLRSRRRLDVAGPRLVLVRVGVRLQHLVDRDRVAADLADQVADLGGRRDHLELAVAGRPDPPQPASEQRRATSAAAATGGRGPRARARARAAATSAKTAPATQAIVAPGGASVLTESQSPTVPSRATRATLASCQLSIRSVKQPGGDRRDDEERGDQQGADDRERRRRRQRDQAEQHGVEAAAAAPGRAAAASGSKPRCEPALADAAALASRVAAAATAGEGDVAAVDQQQAAEEQGLDVGAGAEDVAGEDHAGGEAADEDDRDDAVVALPRRRPSSGSCRR